MAAEIESAAPRLIALSDDWNAGWEALWEVSLGLPEPDRKATDATARRVADCVEWEIREAQSRTEEWLAEHPDEEEEE